MTYPILEFDESTTAVLNPSNFASKQFDTNKMIITFFPEVIEKLLSEDMLELDTVIPGENPVTIYRYKNADVLITLGQVGCPACGGNLDLFNAMGITKVMFCGGGGVLDKSIKVGTLLVVDGAIRDEGFSYHYAPPARVIYTDKRVTDLICAEIELRGAPYMRGLVWTTDAVFRETADKVSRRREEGAKIVEMEQAGCIAVAKFRGFDYGAIIYGGDDVSGSEWDGRNWQTRKGIRYALVELCRDLVSLM